MGNRHFFDSTSEAKCPVKPRSGVAKSRVSVKAVSAEAVCTLTTTPLPWQQASEASGYERPPEKSFFDFYENLQKWSLGKINLPYFGKSAKNFFLLEKNPTSSFKIGGICAQKSYIDL